MVEHDPALVEKAAEAHWLHRIITRNAGGRTGCRGCTWQANAHPGSDAAYREYAEHASRAVLDAVVPAVREATLLDAADRGPSSTPTDQLWKMFIRDLAAQQRDPATRNSVRHAPPSGANVVHREESEQ